MEEMEGRREAEGRRQEEMRGGCLQCEGGGFKACLVLRLLSSLLRPFLTSAVLT